MPITEVVLSRYVRTTVFFRFVDLRTIETANKHKIRASQPEFPLHGLHDKMELDMRGDHNPMEPSIRGVEGEMEPSIRGVKDEMESESYWNGFLLLLFAGRARIYVEILEFPIHRCRALLPTSPAVRHHQGPLPAVEMTVTMIHPVAAPKGSQRRVMANG